MPPARALGLAAALLFGTVLLAEALERFEIVSPDTAATFAGGAALVGLLWTLLSELRRRRAASALSDEELLARGLSASEMLAFYTLDRHGRVGTWSRGAESLFGWSAEEVEGLPITGTIHPRADEAELLTEVGQLLRSGRSHRPHRRSVTSRDGRTVETLCVMVPLSAGGRVSRVAVLHVDPHVTGSAEARWTRLLHAVPAGLIRVDAAGKIEAVNQTLCEWVGRRADALEGADAARCEVFPADFRDGLVEAATKSSSNELVQMEVTLVAADGVTRPCLAFAASRAPYGADVALVDGTRFQQLLAERDAARAAAEAARESASETVTTHRDLTSSVAELMSALDAGPKDPRSPSRRTSAEEDLKRSGAILLANVRRLQAGERRAHGATLAPRVLLVDDNDENRDLLAHMVRTRGADVTAVASGREAVDAVARGWFDIVLLDVQMPEMDGYQVVRRIRALPGGDAITVIALTALGSDSIRERCLAEGMDDFVSKPLTLGKVTEILSRWGRRPQPAG